MQLVGLVQETSLKNPLLLEFGTSTTDQVVPSQDAARGTNSPSVSQLEPTATQSMEVDSVHDTRPKSAVSPKTGVERIDQLNPFQVSTRTDEPELPTATQSVELTHDTPVRVFVWLLVLALGTVDHTCPFQDSVNAVAAPTLVPTAMQKFGPVQETPRSWPPPGVAAAAGTARPINAATGAVMATVRATTSPSPLILVILGAGPLSAGRTDDVERDFCFTPNPPVALDPRWHARSTESMVSIWRERPQPAVPLAPMRTSTQPRASWPSSAKPRARSSASPTMAATKSVAPASANFEMDAATASSSPMKPMSAAAAAPSLSSIAL